MYGKTRALRSAAASGADGVVKELLLDPATDPSVYGDFALRAACANGHISTVAALVAERRVDVSARQNQALRLACAAGHSRIVELLLDGPHALSPVGIGAALTSACEGGHEDIVKCLLANGRLQLSARDAERSMRAALTHGTSILQRLLADARVAAHPQVLQRVLEGAAFLGNLAAVELLLGLPGLTAPAAASHFPSALESAAEAGHLCVVQRLLADGRMSRLELRNSALRAAVRCGHHDVADCLLSDPYLPADPDEASVMTTAVEAGHLQLVKRLAADPRVARRDINFSVVLAPKYGHVTELAYLLRLGEARLNLGAQLGATSVGCVALENACSAGLPTVVRLLLAHPRMGDDNVSRRAKVFLAAAAGARCPAAVQLLLADKRISANVTADEAGAYTARAASPAVAAPSLICDPDWPHDSCFFESASEEELATRTSAELTNYFCLATREGGVADVAAALAQPLLDPQAPVDFCSADAREAGEGPFYADSGTQFALGTAAAFARLDTMEVLLADPCWEPRHVTDALYYGCCAGRPPSWSGCSRTRERS